MISLLFMFSLTIINTVMAEVLVLDLAKVQVTSKVFSQ